MSEELVGKYVDRGEFSSDTEFIKQELEKVVGLFNQIKETKITLQGASSLKEVTTATEEAAKANETFATSTKKVIDVVEQKRQKLAAASGEQGKQIAELNVQLTEQNKVNKEAAINALGLRDAYQKLNAEYIQAQKSAKALQADARINPALQKDADEASKKANGLAEALKRIDATVGQYQRNVGNYTGALSVLQKGLADATAKLDKMSQSERTNSAAGQSLEKQVALLGTLVGQQGKGFASLTSELRNSERALKTMFESGLQGTQSFKELQQVVANATREVHEFTVQQKILSSESPAIAGLTTIARGLGGAYAAGAGFAALFGSENGKVEKELQKLVAVMTLLNGLTELNEVLQKRGAITTALSGIKTAFLSAANAILASVTTKAAVSAGALAVAQEAEAATAVEATVAIGAETVAAEGLAVAATGATVAEGAMAAGAVSAATAITATGLGALIIGIAAAVIYLINSMSDWDEEIKKNAAQLKLWAEAVTAQNEAINEQIALVQDARKAQIEKSKEELAQNEALGQSKEKTLAQQIEISEKEKALANERLRAHPNYIKDIDDQTLALGKENDKIVEQAQKFKDLVDAKRNGFKSINIATGELSKSSTDFFGSPLQSGLTDYIEKFQKGLGIMIEGRDALKKSVEGLKNDEKDYTDASQRYAELRLQAVKLEGDNRRKYILESTKVYAEAQIFINDRILSDDRSTLDQRLEALKSNFEQQKVIIAAEKNAIVNDPTVSGVDKKIAILKAGDKERQAQKNNDVAMKKLKEDFRLRDLAAEVESEKRFLEEKDRFNKALYKNEALSDEMRLQALKDSQDARQNIIDLDFSKTLSTAGISDPDIERIKKTGYFEIENKKITNQELLNLISKYNTDVLRLSNDVADAQLEILQDYYRKDQQIRDKNIKKIAEDFDKTFEDRTDTYNNQLIDLNNFYLKGKISLEKYNRDKLKLDNEYAQEAIKLEIDKQQKLIDELKKEKGVRVQIEEEIVVETNKLKTAQTDKDKEAAAARLAVLKKELTAVIATLGAETALYKQLSALLKSLSDQQKKDNDDNKDGIIAGFEEARKRGETFFSLVDGVLNAITIRKKNALVQEQQDAEDAAAADIARVNASLLTEEQKVASIALINEGLAEKKREIARKEKAAEIEQARFDKIKAIFEIVINTAIAVTKAVTPIGKALQIALGAAQLAIVLATPLPRFKHGKGAGNSYEGPAVVDDGGKNEPIVRADGTIELNTGRPKDRVTWVGSNDIVYPSLDHMLKSIASPGVRGRSVESNGNSEISRKLDQQNRILTQIANKKELDLRGTDTGMTALWKLGSDRISYIEEQTNWNS